MRGVRGENPMDAGPKPAKVAHYDPSDWAELHTATDWLGKSLGLLDGGSLDRSD